MLQYDAVCVAVFVAVSVAVCVAVYNEPTRGVAPLIAYSTRLPIFLEAQGVSSREVGSWAASESGRSWRPMIDHIH